MSSDPNKTGNPQEKDQQENDPSEAMNSPEEVEKSNDKNIDEDFPGYPHYPANDDILDPDNNNGRVDIDVENLSSKGKNFRQELQNEEQRPPDVLVNAPFNEAVDTEEGEDIGIVQGNDADVTPEDLALLGSRERDMDMGEDEERKGSSVLLDKAGYELDTPGAENDDANESIGEEDEENNYYSLGGDNHENLEEDKTAQ